MSLECVSTLDFSMEVCKSLEIISPVDARQYLHPKTPETRFTAKVHNLTFSWYITNWLAENR